MFHLIKLHRRREPIYLSLLLSSEEPHYRFHTKYITIRCNFRWCLFTNLWHFVFYVRHVVKSLELNDKHVLIWREFQKLFKLFTYLFNYLQNWSFSTSVRILLRWFFVTTVSYFFYYIHSLADKYFLFKLMIRSLNFKKEIFYENPEEELRFPIICS